LILITHSIVPDGSAVCSSVIKAHLGASVGTRSELACGYARVEWSAVQPVRNEPDEVDHSGHTKEDIIENILIYSIAN